MLSSFIVFIVSIIFICVVQYLLSYKGKDPKFEMAVKFTERGAKCAEMANFAFTAGYPNEENASHVTWNPGDEVCLFS
jgi:hypothetical protein